MSRTHDQVVATPAGYWWHHHRREPACQPCRDAHRLATRQRRDSAHPDQARTLVPLALLGRMLNTLPEPMRHHACDQLGDDTVTRALTLAEHTRHDH